MSKREAIARYHLIIKKLRKHLATFDEIADYLSLESEIQEYNFNISKRTFQRDIRDIRSIYNIDIQYNRSGKYYYIDFDENPEINERILEAFDTFNALNITNKFSNFINFEKRRALGTENLYGLLHAIKNRLQVKFTYHKYWENKFTERIAEPYALKEFRNRWYVLAKDHKDNRIKSFALDRLTDLLIMQRHFKYPQNFDINEYYQYCFGIVSPNKGLPEKVILSFTAYQGRYIKSLPIHETQKILVDNDKELRIQIEVYLTYDLLIEILSYGGNVKVIKPKSLKQEIKTVLNNALKQY